MVSVEGICLEYYFVYGHFTRLLDTRICFLKALYLVGVSSPGFLASNTVEFECEIKSVSIYLLW